MKYAIITVKTKAGWHWRIVAKNKRIIASSEVYSSHTKAIKTINSFINAVNIGQISILDTITIKLPRQK